RLILEMDSQGIEFPKLDPPDIFIGVIGEKAEKFAENLALDIRAAGIVCHKDIMGRSVKAQMKYANKLKAGYSIILGDNEIESGKAELRNMLTGEVKDISIDTLIDRLMKYRGK
ncbi:MAG: histidine--tRNA ligase, partial [Clostridiaceae bacterium]|nr:histidine--tRNA ligase [Clostridiaceae bacterium]